jgi:TonB family protein
LKNGFQPKFGLFGGGDDPEDRVRRKTAALVSLGAHLLLALLVALLAIPLEVVILDRKVADVTITPLPSVFIPALVRGDEGGVVSPPSGGAVPSGPPGSPEEASPSEGPPPASAASSRSRSLNEAVGRFRLAVPLVDYENLPVKEGLILSPYADNIWFPEKSGADPVPAIDLTRYSGWRAGYSMDAGGPLSGSAPAGGGIVQLRGEPVNLGPWAEGAIASLQENWFLSPRHQPAFKGMVEVRVTVSKSGEPLEIELLRSSGTEELDASALKALHIAPLPGLPEPFPGDRLDIRLIFEVR